MTVDGGPNVLNVNHILHRVRPFPASHVYYACVCVRCTCVECLAKFPIIRAEQWKLNWT